MAQKVMIMLFSILVLNGKSQSDSAEIRQYFYLSFDDWMYDDTHTIYGYGFSKGKSNFHVGISIERKRLPNIPISDYNWFLLGGLSHDWVLKDTVFSVTANAITFGYSYFFKDKNRFTFYPYVNFYINYYRNKGTFEGEIENGVTGTDHYTISRWDYFGILGWGCRYNINSKLTAKMELGAGLGMVNNYYTSDYFGNNSNWEWWAYGFGRLGLYYRFK